jgi:hypothetical protein
MLQAVPVCFFPDRHAVALGYAAGGEIFGANKRDQALGVKVLECPVAASNRRFRGQALMPMVAAQVVTDFVKPLALEFLTSDSAIADQFAGDFQKHGPEADPIILVALAIARDPLFDSGAIVGRRIVTHGLGIGEDVRKVRGIFWAQFAQAQAGCFNVGHGGGSNNRPSLTTAANS